jgi:hypothetical protein
MVEVRSQKYEVRGLNKQLPSISRVPSYQLPVSLIHICKLYTGSTRHTSLVPVLLIGQKKPPPLRFQGFFLWTKIWLQLRHCSSRFRKYYFLGSVGHATAFPLLTKVSNSHYNSALAELFVHYHSSYTNAQYKRQTPRFLLIGPYYPFTAIPPFSHPRSHPLLASCQGSSTDSSA